MQINQLERNHCDSCEAVKGLQYDGMKAYRMCKGCSIGDEIRALGEYVKHSPKTVRMLANVGNLTKDELLFLIDYKGIHMKEIAKRLDMRIDDFRTFIGRKKAK